MEVEGAAIDGPAQQSDGISLAWERPAGPSRESLCHCASGRASYSAVQREREIKGRLAARSGPPFGMQGGFNRHVQPDRAGGDCRIGIEEDGLTVFHRVQAWPEGIVSKRKDSPYRSGRSADWLKSKNPAHAAVRREEEEEWGR
jgi:hypothetical protein